AVADRGGAVAVGGGDGRIVPERRHARVELCQRGRRVRGDPVALAEDAVGGVADRLVALRLRIGGGDLLRRQVAEGGGIVRGPHVPHRDREVEQVAGVDRRAREIDADRRQRLLVPLPGDRERTRGRR